MSTIVVLIGIVIISLFVVKIGTVALRMTGIDEKTASFQALSAFSGTGFTTREAELIVNNPRRRKITKVLMIVGNAGIASTVAALILSFSMVTKTEVLMNVVLLGIGLLVVYKFAVARWLHALLDKIIADRLGGVRYLGIPAFQEVIGLAKGYGISSIDVKPDGKLAGHTLEELRLSRQGVLVLAIHRGRELVSSPTGSTRIEANDRLVCYGSLRAAKDVTVALESEDGDKYDPEQEQAEAE